MTTIAATHPLLLTSVLQKSLKLSSSSIQEHSAKLLASNIMHPDCLQLQNHGINSPSLASMKMEEKQQEEDLLEIEDDSEAEEEEEGNHSLQQSEEREEANDELEEEELSICSEDSNLSVGCENGNQQTGSNNLTHNLRAQRLLSLNNMGNLMQLNRASAFSSVMNQATTTVIPAVDISDARSSASTLIDETQVGDEDSLSGSAGMRLGALPQLGGLVIPNANSSPFQQEFLRKSHLYAEELMRHQMQLMAAARVGALNMQQHAGVTGGLLLSEANAAATAADKAAQLSNFAGIRSHLSAISKIGQLSAVASAAAVAAAASNRLQNQSQTKGISSLQQLEAQMQAHLPTLMPEQMEHGQNEDEPALKFSIDNILKADFGRRITDPLLKRQAAQSHRNSLRAAKHAKLHGSKISQNPSSGSSTELNNLMSSSVSNASSLNFSNTLANICTNSNDSSSTMASSNATNCDLLKSPNSQLGIGAVCGTGSGAAASVSSLSPQPADKQAESSEEGEGKSAGTGASGNGPIVWPAWVYCTRYSDRPSSGT